MQLLPPASVRELSDYFFSMLSYIFTNKTRNLEVKPLVNQENLIFCAKLSGQLADSNCDYSRYYAIQDATTTTCYCTEVIGFFLCLLAKLEYHRREKSICSSRGFILKAFFQLFSTSIDNVSK